MSCIGTLKAKGLKLTLQRRLIADTIHDTNVHLTIEGIISHVQAMMPEVHKSTIYRTLDLLERTGCVYKSELDTHAIYHHAEEGRHHHLVCSRCGKMIDCDEDLFKSVENALVEQYGFHVDFNHLVMSGLCEECISKNS